MVVGDTLKENAGFAKPVFTLGWICVGSMALWLVYSNSIDSDRIGALIAGSLCILALIFSKYVLRLSFTSAPLLYMILLALFHLGLVVPWSLGIYDIGRVSWIAPRGLFPALRLVILSVVSYQLGIAVASIGFRATKVADAEVQRGETPSLYYGGLFLFVVGVLMFLIGLMRLDSGAGALPTYSETFRLRAESDPRLFGTGMMFAGIALPLATAGAFGKRLHIVWLCSACWVLGLLFLGFRGPALILGLLVYALTLKKGIHVPKSVGPLAITLLLFAIPTVRLVRDSLGPRTAGELLRDVHYLDSIAEMGGSLRALIETEALIGPSGYRYGGTYLAAVKTVVPNTSATWQPSRPGSIEDMRPNHWVTAMANPWAFRNYGGIGFSAVAEPYMNFGFLGVVVYFFGLGFVLVWLEQRSTTNPYALALWALVLGPLLWTTRNDFHNFVRPVVWGVGYVIFMRLLVEKWFPYFRRTSGFHPAALSPISSRHPRMDDTK